MKLKRAAKVLIKLLGAENGVVVIKDGDVILSAGINNIDSVVLEIGDEGTEFAQVVIGKDSKLLIKSLKEINGAIEQLITKT